eukprot:scaffold309611_cov36-Tisochrysis_lutea.AAC.2
MSLPFGRCLSTTQGCVRGFNPVHQFHSYGEGLGACARPGARVNETLGVRRYAPYGGIRDTNCAKTSKEVFAFIDGGLGHR